jgi:radical SAM-linked protein
MMGRLRITFSKQGALRYTGHLDLHKLWERAARRAELPLAYSQGYHPQPKISLASALPLGLSSRAEILDMKLEQTVSPDEVLQRMEANLPTGIQILKVETIDEGAPALQTQVTSAEYEVALLEPPDQNSLQCRVAEILAAESLPRERRGKPYDLRPLLLSLVYDGQSSLRMELAAREGGTGRPEEVLVELGIAPEITRIERSCLHFQGESVK